MLVINYFLAQWEGRESNSTWNKDHFNPVTCGTAIPQSEATLYLTVLIYIVSLSFL